MANLRGTGYSVANLLMDTSGWLRMVMRVG